MIGKILGDRYEIIEEIGSGGMAIVYKAKCKMLNRVVAVKVLKDEFKKDESIVSKFNRESQAAASLTHPNIVSVYDVGRDNDDYYIVMELVQGQNLKDYIRENPKMDWRQALKYAMQISSAIAHAHRNGIIHRDIKPHNIILSKDGNCKVADFGIASMNKNAETQRINEGIMGSVHYISPEVAKGKIGDEKSDIYSLGVTIYELLTGVVPFDNENPVSVALMHINQTPKAIKDINIAVPLVLVQIVNKAMHKDAAQRYQSANELYKALYAISNEPDYFTAEPETGSDAKNHTITIDTKTVREEMEKSASDTTEKEEIITESDFTEEPEQKTPEDVVKVDIDDSKERKKEKRKKGFLTDLFQVNNPKDKVAIIAAVIVSLIMIGTVLGIAVGVLFPGGGTSGDGEFVIPEFTGKNINEVTEEYKNTELKITIVKEFDEDTPADIIIHQNVPKDKKVKLPYEIKLTVSRGEREIILSSYINKEARQVELEINELGLTYAEKEEFNEEIPVGYVISQDPLPGEEVEDGDKITFVVSKGADNELVEVPELVGLTEAQAKSRLTDYEFVLGGIIRKPSNEPEGTVIEQSAPAGSELIKKSKITLTLSNGKKQNQDEDKPSSSDGDTTSENKPSTNKQSDEDTSVTVKKYNLALTLPEGKEEVEVKVVQDGETVYNKKVSTKSKNLNITLEGNGNHSIVVYYDDMLVKTQKIKI
ncbi:MAG: Stk1 family PASTA domain-containing Ser/Thr kinase [Ruminococcaceae bacterium]|nr:Stk1 family PASTA domain-containing Ser/Thr kinase [Oscillospiraceae bacterium]